MWVVESQNPIEAATIMATYEYRCKACGHEFEVTETITRHEEKKRPPKCPECKSSRTRRVYSSFFAKTSSKA